MRAFEKCRKNLSKKIKYKLWNLVHFRQARKCGSELQVSLHKLFNVQIQIQSKLRRQSRVFKKKMGSHKHHCTLHFLYRFMVKIFTSSFIFKKNVGKKNRFQSNIPQKVKIYKPVAKNEQHSLRFAFLPPVVQCCMKKITV